MLNYTKSMLQLTDWLILEGCDTEYFTAMKSVEMECYCKNVVLRSWKHACLFSQKSRRNYSFADNWLNFAKECFDSKI